MLLLIHIGASHIGQAGPNLLGDRGRSVETGGECNTCTLVHMYMQ